MIYRLADTVFSLETVYPYTRRMLADYAVEGEPAFSLVMRPEDIESERARLTEPAPDPYIESLAVYRRLCDRLLDKDILLFHGSAVAVDGQVYIFTAKSGTGKSTHARLWRQMLGDRAVMVNDDKPLLGLAGAGVTVYGTPWDGKHHLSANLALPLKAVCILTRDETNWIRPIPAGEALPTLLQQAYRPEALDRILPLVTRLADAVPLYRLGCNMEPEAAEVSWKGMQ